MTAAAGGTPGIDDAVERLRAGGLVAFPTETVYGLGADATQTAAVERVFAVKGRPRGHPLIVHLADAGAVRRRGRRRCRPPPGALADAHWPGPLTLLARARRHGCPTS